MTDAELRSVHRRIATILHRDGCRDHYYACVVLSDLSSVPFERVWAACADATE